MFSAARLTAWLIRRCLVSGCLAMAIHSRISRLKDGGKFVEVLLGGFVPVE